jgi:hypothetical protein
VPSDGDGADESALAPHRSRRAASNSDTRRSKAGHRVARLRAVVASATPAASFSKAAARSQTPRVARSGRAPDQFVRVRDGRRVRLHPTDRREPLRVRALELHRPRDWPSTVRVTWPVAYGRDSDSAPTVRLFAHCQVPLIRSEQSGRRVGRGAGRGYGPPTQRGAARRHESLDRWATTTASHLTESSRM